MVVAQTILLRIQAGVILFKRKNKRKMQHATTAHATKRKGTSSLRPS